MTLRKLIDEDDILETDSGDIGKNKFYIVKRVEDLVLDKRDFATDATTTGTESSSIQITDLDPKDIEVEGTPAIGLYQVYSGVDIGMIYVEILAGEFRRTPYKVKRPGSSNRYVGFFDEHSSPYEAPTFEFFVRHNEVPAFTCYNNWDFSINPDLAFRGRQLQIYDLSSPKIEEYFDLGGMAPSMLKEVRQHKRAHRHITLRGIER